MVISLFFAASRLPRTPSQMARNCVVYSNHILIVIREVHTEREWVLTCAFVLRLFIMRLLALSVFGEGGGRIIQFHSHGQTSIRTVRIVNLSKPITAPTSQRTTHARQPQVTYHIISPLITAGQRCAVRAGDECNMKCDLRCTFTCVLVRVPGIVFDK